MSLKKQIKTLTALFIVLLIGFAASAIVLFRQNTESFNAFFHEKSRGHLKVLKTLSQIETAVFIHHNSVSCAVAQGDDKCFLNAKEAKSQIADDFDAVEKFNRGEFREWVSLQSPAFQDPAAELRDMLASGRTRSADTPLGEGLQRLFFLVRGNLSGYFDTADKRMQAAVASGVATPVADDPDAQRDQLDLIYLGLKELKDIYNEIYWSDSRGQTALFSTSSRLYYYALIASCGLLAVLAVIVALLTGRQFRVQQQRDENLILLGTRDMATGLFNRRSMEVLLTQEIHRAKRRNYPLNALMLRIEPYDDLLGSLGQVAVDRLFFQIAEVLKSSCRAYDSVFKSDRNTFVMVFPESSPKIVNGLIERFRKSLQKKRFLVKSDQTKAAPTLLMGASGYPMHGQSAAELIAHAEMTLSENFDAVIVHKQTPLASVPAQTAEAPKPVASGGSEAPPDDDGSGAKPPESKPTAPEARAAIPEPRPQTPAATPTKAQIPVPAQAPQRPVATPPARDPAPVQAESVAPPRAEPSSLEKSPAPLAGIPVTKSASETPREPRSETASAVKPTLPARAAEKTAPQPEKRPAPVPQAADDGLPDVVSALMQNDESARTRPQTAAGPAFPPAPKFEPTAPAIKVIQSAGEDVILVDFDREKRDLAESFRKRKGGPAS